MVKPKLPVTATMARAVEKKWGKGCRIPIFNKRGGNQAFKREVLKHLKELTIEEKHQLYDRAEPVLKGNRYMEEGAAAVYSSMLSGVEACLKDVKALEEQLKGFKALLENNIKETVEAKHARDQMVVLLRQQTKHPRLFRETPEPIIATGPRGMFRVPTSVKKSKKGAKKAVPRTYGREIKFDKKSKQTVFHDHCTRFRNTVTKALCQPGLCQKKWKQLVEMGGKLVEKFEKLRRPHVNVDVSLLAGLLRQFVKMHTEGFTTEECPKTKTVTTEEFLKTRHAVLEKMFDWSKQFKEVSEELYEEEEDE
ncbi:uncharacterized protein LOC129592521 [Paramacrobiotus metropolitanus]|uniref:uncharacterized protein LOC129592521 n=1 Tax=Paramacrobiotus metropolitanus TaxID=2943436 RepID=UPI002446300C|nr:uncharacterized protein LOC129592521 [Paramacrobiotus metropolitanus]